MLGEWITGEHHRLHIVEEWPDGAYKEAVLTAIRSTLNGLARDFRAAINPPVCIVCNSRKSANDLQDRLGGRRGATDHNSLGNFTIAKRGKRRFG